MSLLGMPMLVLNMAGEMVYILHLRLDAQSINSDRSKRVMVDVVRACYNPKFVNELFNPQEMYTMPSVRGVFDRLAHSSIMKLSKSSMDKLFDLQVMGVKYQFQTATSPKELVDITLNHLDEMKQLVSSSKSTTEYVNQVIDKVKKTYSNLTMGEFILLQQTLLRFLQDRRVKVSLFLQEGMQQKDGFMTRDMNSPLPLGVRMPGTVKYCLNKPSKMTTFATIWKPTTEELKKTELGRNIYAKNKAKKEKEQMVGKKEDKKEDKKEEKKEEKVEKMEEKQEESAIIHTTTSTQSRKPVDGLNLLSDLVRGGEKDPVRRVDEKFGIDLFDGTGFFAEPIIEDEKTDDAKEEKTMDELHFDAEKDIKQYNQPLHKLLEEFRFDAVVDDGDGRDDLLDLMDSVADE